MSSKINVSKIIVDHILTMKDGKRWSLSDLFTFYLLPAGLSAGLVYCLDINLTDEFATFIITLLTIVTGLLFNLLVLIYNISLRNDRKTDKELELLQHVFSHISYTIFVCILTVFLLVLYYVLPISYQTILSLVTIYFLGNIGLTMLMVLKRMRVVMKRDFDS